jgi:molybdate transport system substrate-binding protein
VLAVVGVLLLATAACRKPAGADPRADHATPAAPAKAAETQLVIFAAASLREAFTALGADFEKTHAGVELTFNFAGTQELRTQLEHGAAADVFAAADQKHMDALVGDQLASAPAVFARNEPVIVVAREAVATVKSLADLPRAKRIVIGTPEVPIGRYTLEILDRAAPTLGADFRARVEKQVVSRELNVRQVLAKVTLGEADAGVVYRTDAQGKADLTVVRIPPEVNVIAGYPIAAVTNAAHPELAKAWVDHVLSAAGQKSLAAAGFLPPGAGK